MIQAAQTWAETFPKGVAQGPQEAKGAAGATGPKSSHAIVVRRMGFPFGPEIPRYWFGGDPFFTHLINGLHFVFPAGERYFIRSVRHFEDRLEDEELLAEIRNFFGQEAQHQVEHLHAFGAIEEQGLEIRSFLKWYEHLAYDIIEPATSPVVRLAVTAALEHYTAIFGEFVLTSDFLKAAHPVMRDLLLWHAAEEIEHKAVTFNVLQKIDPRYRIRLAGWLLGTLLLFFFWLSGLRHLLKQEKKEVRRSTAGSLRAFVFQEMPKIVKNAVGYLRPSFHPDQHDNYHLAESYLAKIGRLHK